MLRIERVEQRLCLFEVGRFEAFGEPDVDRIKDVTGFGAAALVVAEPGEAHGGAQFPQLGVLLAGDAQGIAIQLLGGFGTPLVPGKSPTGREIVSPGDPTSW